MKHVCVFRHALALDELRVKFLPEYANGGAGPQVDDGDASRPRIKEVWFSGTHSDMQVCKLRLSAGGLTDLQRWRQRHQCRQHPFWTSIALDVVRGHQVRTRDGTSSRR